MNRKSKVIVSIVGITIVLLALLGITYAYYLTRIEGNTNTNSVSITTADLKLSYSDGNEIIIENNIVPGTTIGEKTFTVSNTGNSLIEDYKVVLEYAVIENVVPSVFVRPEDFEITLTCVSKNIETNEESGTCSGYTGTWNNESFEMTFNDIAENIKHEYSLTIFYANPDIDQSDDMGKNLNLKVQIYGANETSTITGTINNVDETYAMKLNSNPKISTIKKITDSEGNIKYQYKFIGVEPNKDGESHTLTLVNKNDEEQSTGNLTIKKGTTGNIDGSTITFKDNQTNIYLTTGSESSILTNSATFNPYIDNTNSLAYHIINNSINNANGTIYRDVPLTLPGKESSKLISYNNYGEEYIYINNMNISDYLNKKWYYYDTYEVNTSTGKFTLSGKKSCIFSNCYSDLVGKYLYNSSASSNTGAGYHNAETKSYLENVYKIVETTATSLRYVTLRSFINEAERVLSPTIDDYGTSYYYRGDVKDNFVNFAGMCWRIVRIEGDGSVKLILEDISHECNDVNYTGNWSDGNTYDFGYDDNHKADFLNYEGGLADSFKTFQTSNLTPEDIEKLKVDEWCYDDRLSKRESFECDKDWDEEPDECITDYYESYIRIIQNKRPSLRCSGKKITKFKDNTNMYVGTLTVDEMTFAGAKYFEENKQFYLMNTSKKRVSLGWVTLSLSTFDEEEYGADLVFSFAGNQNRLSISAVVNDTKSSRPVINLKSDINILNGNGTQDNPYVIN